MTIPSWLGTLMVFGFPALGLLALALWLVALSRRLPYAEDHDTKETLEGLKRIAGRW